MMTPVFIRKINVLACVERAVAKQQPLLWRRVRPLTLNSVDGQAEHSSEQMLSVSRQDLTSTGGGHMRTRVCLFCNVTRYEW
jgi:hypothetical protein